MNYNTKLIKIIQYVIVIILVVSFILLKNYEYMCVLWICYGIFLCVEIYKIVCFIKNKFERKSILIEIGKIVGLGIIIVLLNIVIHNSPNL